MSDALAGLESNPIFQMMQPNAASVEPRVAQRVLRLL